MNFLEDVFKNELSPFLLFLFVALFYLIWRKESGKREEKRRFKNVQKHE